MPPIQVDHSIIQASQIQQNLEASKFMTPAANKSKDIQDGIHHMSASLPRHKSLHPPEGPSVVQELTGIKNIHEQMNQHKLQLDNGEHINLANSALIQSAKAANARAITLEHGTFANARLSQGTVDSRRSNMRGG